MKVSSKIAFSNLLHAAGFRGNRTASDYAADERPLRSELFSGDQMDQHGKTLAGSHKVN